MAKPGIYTEDEKKMLAEWKEMSESRAGWLEDEPNEKWAYPVANRVATKELMVRVASLIDYWNPLWRDENYARNTRWGGLTAPPMYIHFISFGAASIPKWMIPPSVGIRIMDPMERMIPDMAPFWNTYEFFKPIRVNDSFRIWVMPASLEDITDPDGKGPRVFKVVSSSKIFNQNDDLVYTESMTEKITIVPGPVEKKEKKPYQPFQAYRYSKEELATIDRMADEEEVRGAKTRYWEDVNVGDEVKPIVHGPITIWDQLTTIVAGGLVTIPMREVRRKTPKWVFVDPVTGVTHKTIEAHLSENLAAVLGWPFAAAGNELAMSRIVTNWMGDDGFMKRLDWRMESCIMVGDTVFGRGKVVKKYIENGENLVDLDIWLDDMGGNKAVLGRSTVSLPSNKDYYWLGE